MLYRLLWEALAHIQSDRELRLRETKDLEFLSRVPQGERTEFFYLAYEYGLNLIGNDVEKDKVHQEQLRRYPRGRAMQFLLLSQARNQQDPVESARLYEKFAADYRSIFPMAAEAERERFLLIRDHPKNFVPAMLYSAAAAWSESELVDAKKFDRPFSYLSALKQISDSFASSAPKKSLEYSSMAKEYIERTWPDTTLYDEEYTATFLPVELEARVADHQWKSAKRVGDHLEPYIEKGRLPRDAAIDKEQEVKFRSEYGLALEMSGDLDGAFQQFGLASTLDEKRLQDLSDFVGRHRQFQTPMDVNQASWRRALDDEMQLRDRQHRNEVLAKEVHLMPEPFTLPSLSGGTVSLESFRGKPLVLVFWASWCHYCNEELDELEKLTKTQTADSFNVVAISVDTDRNLARQFAKDRSLQFPLAFSDGTVDAAYQTDFLPQLYILYDQGFIRFHVAGTEIDFMKTVRFMLQASAISPKTNGSN